MFYYLYSLYSWRCGICGGCVAQDCEKCCRCLDKPKFGGKGLMKQCCLRRHCKRENNEVSQGEGTRFIWKQKVAICTHSMHVNSGSFGIYTKAEIEVHSMELMFMTVTLQLSKIVSRWLTDKMKYNKS